MDEQPTNGDRREFLGALPTWFMLGGLSAGYGGCAAMGGAFLFPTGDTPRAWMLVAPVGEIEVGAARDYRAPNGQSVAIARRGNEGTAEDFIALSSVCPHLGCQVHWEGLKDRFFCPCHNGAFDAEGTGISGPPGDAGQSLPRFPLKVENGLLFIEVPVEGLASNSEDDPGSARDREA